MGESVADRADGIAGKRVADPEPFVVEEGRTYRIEAGVIREVPGPRPAWTESARRGAAAAREAAARRREAEYVIDAKTGNIVAWRYVDEPPRLVGPRYRAWRTGQPFPTTRPAGRPAPTTRPRQSVLPPRASRESRGGPRRARAPDDDGGGGEPSGEAPGSALRAAALGDGLTGVQP